MRISKLLIVVFIAAIFSAGCHRRQAAAPQPTIHEQVVIVPPPAPEGTEKYCWQEPKVITEKNGPGVDEEGHWYHPKYDAIREVKQGRWVPCSENAK